MTPTKSPGNRPYQRRGLSALQSALKAAGDQQGWLDALGEVGDALKAWKAGLVSDLGGADSLSTQELALVEMADLLEAAGRLSSLRCPRSPRRC